MRGDEYAGYGAGVERRAVGILFYESADFVAVECLRREQCESERRRYLDGHVQPCPAARAKSHGAPAQLFVLPAGHDVRFCVVWT